MSEKVYYLRNQDVISNAINFIANLKPDDNEPMEVVIRRRKRKRTDPQRALFWVWMREIRKHLLDSTGQAYSEQELHDWFCAKFLPVKFVKVNGEAKVSVQGTSDLTKDEMRQFLDQIDMYCAGELDLLLPVGEV